jgi:hypothetical protein
MGGACIVWHEVFKSILAKNPTDFLEILTNEALAK